MQVYATLGVKPNPTIKQRVRNEINQYKKEVEKLRKAGKKQIVKPPTNNVVFYGLEHIEIFTEFDASACGIRLYSLRVEFASF